MLPRTHACLPHTHKANGLIVCLHALPCCVVLWPLVLLQKVCIQEDGVHLTPEGQKVYFDAVFDTIEKKLPHIK